MKWSPSTIAGFAIKAGWKDKDLVTAVAVALASSDGVDDIVHIVDLETDSKVVGLWLVPSWYIGRERVDSLTNPFANALIAYELWSTSGHDWQWSPVFQVGSWKLRLPEAREAVKSPQFGESVLSPIIPVDSGPNRRTALTAVKELIEQVIGFARASRH